MARRKVLGGTDLLRNHEVTCLNLNKAMFKFAMLKFSLLLVVFLLSYPALAKHSADSEAGDEEHHHTQRHLLAHDKDIESLQKAVSRDEEQIQKLQQKLDSSGVNFETVEDLKKMDATIEKHNTYFQMLTGFTGIIAAAMVGELVRRWKTNKTEEE